MHTRSASYLLATLILMAPAHGKSEELVNGRRSLVFVGQAAKLVVDLAGGSIVDFHPREQELNPLDWAGPKAGDTAPRAFGHFLCLDRWGPPSAAEGANGMPYHGEAAQVQWQLLRDVSLANGFLEAEMAAKLPLAGISVKRTVSLSRASPFFTVREEIKNENRLGRIYNAVQHPTIGPPFLDETTVVDCNGRHGFAQGGSLPNPEEPSFYWPKALNQDGDAVNIRHLTNDPNPNVVSYAIDDEYGWVTAATPAKKLLIGYIWKSKDYPWVSLWRDVQGGKPSARGLEFGTTGLHQPYPVLVRQGRIFGRPLFEHLDAGEAVTKSYAAFLLTIPSDYSGVGRIQIGQSGLILRERSGGKTRELILETAGPLLQP
ncbi:MAG: hypothetical protein L0Z50_00340 [Verrucomicrobiales bacterium]|nr:hypothetical protein [Verrucomicrobiales bacterium]